MCFSRRDFAGGLRFVHLLRDRREPTAVERRLRRLGPDRLHHPGRTLTRTEWRQYLPARPYAVHAANGPRAHDVVRTICLAPRQELLPEPQARQQTTAADMKRSGTAAVTQKPIWRRPCR